METALIVLAVVAVAGVVAWIAKSRTPDAPTQPVTHEAPAQLRREDFADPHKPWLVAVFSSATCSGCEDVVAKAKVLESDQVALHIVEYGANQSLHERYRITGVPLVVFADNAGVVRQHYFGAVSATHLWAGLAEVREPGSAPGCGGEHHDHDAH
jgi:hypothetical protein